MSLNPNAAAYPGAYLTTAAEEAGVWTQYHKLSDGSDALYKITENSWHHDGNPMWATVEVMDTASSSALGLVAGRTFTLTSDLPQSAAPSATYLSTNPNQGLAVFHTYDSGLWMPSDLPVDWTAD